MRGHQETVLRAANMSSPSTEAVLNGSFRRNAALVMVSL